MDLFARAKAVRLRSQHNKFLVAAEDEESVKQSRSGSSKNARWSVESVDNKPNVIRLKNCLSWKYLRATDDPFLLGMTGRRVGQTSPRLRLDPTVEWEPIREGSHVKLRTRKGNFLRANGGIPPWNNSITHDVPSRTSTQDWILWTVDVLEVDYESTPPEINNNVEEEEEEVQEGSHLSRNSSSSGSTISKADYFKDCYEVDESPTSKPATPFTPSSLHQVKQSGEVYSGGSNGDDQFYRSSLSRNSSSGSTISSRPDNYKECSEKEDVPPAAPKPVRSVRRNSTTQPLPQSPNASSQASEKQTRVSPFANHVRGDTKHSASFNKLRSVLDGLGDLLDDDNGHEEQSEAESKPMVESPLHKPHLLEVKMAKHTLKELSSFDYETFLSSGKEKKLEEAIKVLIADFKMSGRGQVPEELQNLCAQLKAMRQDHDSASQDMEEYTAYSIRRLEVKGELKKDSTKAHELETLELGLSNTLTSSRAKKQELLKQLEEVENSITVTEKELADNGVAIDELVSIIGEKSESLREMERKEKSWQTRKVDAESTLEKVEDDWVKMKSLFEDV